MLRQGDFVLTNKQYMLHSSEGAKTLWSNVESWLVTMLECLQQVRMKLEKIFQEVKHNFDEFFRI